MSDPLRVTNTGLKVERLDIVLNLQVSSNCNYFQGQIISMYYVFGFTVANKNL